MMRAKRRAVDETVVDETVVDGTVVDETVVDETARRRDGSSTGRPVDGTAFRRDGLLPFRIRNSFAAEFTSTG